MSSLKPIFFISSLFLLLGCGDAGEYTQDEIAIEPVITLEELPLVDISTFRYKGGFRIPRGRFGENTNATASYSQGIMTYNAENHSIFLVGHSHESMIAEFAIPELVNSNNYLNYNISPPPIQNFVDFYQTDRVDTGISSNFRVSGMQKHLDKLIVNYVNWYDAEGTETDTTIVFDNAADLAQSKIFGPYQIDGAAHAAGWISSVPEQWQSVLGGSIISGGNSSISIISRTTVGPSAFSFYPGDDLLSKTSGRVISNKLLDYPLSNILKIEERHVNLSNNSVLLNEDLKNDLWTFLSKGAYGFIIPDTRSYIVIGYSGGMHQE